MHLKIGNDYIQINLKTFC